MTGKALALVALSLGVALSSPALAEPEAAAAKPGAQRATGEIGLASLASDRYALLTAGTELAAGPVRAALHVPLRLRITDKAPLEAGKTPGLRQEDWDQPGDWARLLHYGEWRWKNGRLRVGGLAGVTLGHGFLVDRFYNNLDFDRHETGVRLNHDGDNWGVEAMLQDVVQPEVMALRGFARPGPKWTLGATVAIDAAAPTAVRASTPAGVILPGTRLTSEPLTLTGLDAAREVWRDGARTAVAYLDFALGHRPGGAVGGGGQLGLALHLTPSKGVEVDTRLALRLQTPRYAPGWFDTAYALDRHGRKGLFPKLDRHSLDDKVMAGAGLAVDVRTRQALQLSLALDADQMPNVPDPRLQARFWLTVPDLAGLQARAMLAWRNDDPGDVLDGFVLAHAVLRYTVAEGPFYAATTAARRWRQRGLDGIYAPETELTATAGAEVRF